MRLFCPQAHLLLSLSFSFHFSPLFLLDNSFVPLWVWNLTTLVNDKLGVQVRVAGVVWEPHLVQYCAVHWRWQEGLWLWGIWPPDSLFLLGSVPRMELLMWIAAQGDWIPIKRPSPWPGPPSHQRHNFYWAGYEPGQLLNPVQPALRNLGPGNRGVGVGVGLGRWSWGDWRWKLKGTFD